MWDTWKHKIIRTKERPSTLYRKTRQALHFPPKPNLEHIKAIKDNDDDNLFDSDEEEDGEEDENKVDDLYKNKPKAYA